jgi:transposase
MKAKEQERRRREGYRLLKQGQPQAAVARAVGVSRQTTSRWAERLKTHGRKSWRSVGKRGRKPRLGTSQRAELRQLLKAGAVAAGYPNALWTLPRVASFIERQWGIRLGKTQVWRVLREQLGWSCQRPDRRARERNEAKIAAWKRDVWPLLRAQAIAEKRIIVFVDESGLSQRPTRVRTWAPVGQTPHLEFCFNWKTLSAMAGVSLYQFYFKLVEGSVKTPHVIEFLRQLQARIARPMLVIWDGLAAHKSRAVRDHVEGTSGQIRLAYLPAYAPELNPVEYLWGHWKHHEIPNLCAATLSRLSHEARRALRRMQRRPSLIRAFWIQSELSL